MIGRRAHQEDQSPNQRSRLSTIPQSLQPAVPLAKDSSKGFPRIEEVQAPCFRDSILSNNPVLQNSHILQQTLRREHQHSLSRQIEPKLLKIPHESPNKSSNDIAINSPQGRFNFSDLERTAPNSPRFSLKREELSVAQVKQLHDRERSMLLQYVYTWHNVGISFLKEGYFSQALPCFENSIKIYESLLMYLHLSAAKTDYFFCRIMLLLQDEEPTVGLALLQDQTLPNQSDYSEIKSKIIQASRDTEAADKFHNDANLGLNFFLSTLALLIGEVKIAYSCIIKTKNRLVGESIALLVRKRIKNRKLQSFWKMRQKSRTSMLNCQYRKPSLHSSKSWAIESKYPKHSILKNQKKDFSFQYQRSQETTSSPFLQILQSKKTFHFRKYKQVFLESASLVDILLSPKLIKDNLLELGHIIRVWLQMPAQAIYFYDQALSIEQDCEQGHFFMGLTLRVLGYPVQALKAYQRALQLKPNFPDCLFNIGNLYLEELRDLDLSQKYYHNALSLLEDYEPQPQTSSAQMSESEPLIKEGNVYNALSELYRVKNMKEQSVEMLLNGIVADPAFLDNYVDLTNELMSRNLENLANLVQFSFQLFRTEEIKESVAFNNQLKRFKSLTFEVEKGSVGAPHEQFCKRIVEALKRAFQFFDIKQCNSFEVFLEKLEQAVPS